MSIDLTFTSSNYNGGTSISTSFDSTKFNSDFTTDGLGYLRTIREESNLIKTGEGKAGFGISQVSSNQNLLPKYTIEFELVLLATEMTDLFEIFDAQYKSSSLGLEWSLTLNDNFIPEPLTMITISNNNFVRQNSTETVVSPPENTPPGTDLEIFPRFDVAMVDLIWDWAFKSNLQDYHIVKAKFEELDPILVQLI